MAETLITLKTRRSCRAYKPELIEEEKLNAISPLLILLRERRIISIRCNALNSTAVKGDPQLRLGNCDHKSI